jgi:putative phosphoesterase
MKLGIISDIHGNAPALKAVLGAMRGQVDECVFLGDLVGYYSFAEECIALGRHELKIGVLGNHDEIFLRCSREQSQLPEEYTAHFGSALERTLNARDPETLALVSSWPLTRKLEFAGTSIFMCHGAPWDPLHARVYPDFQDWEKFSEVAQEIILLGHTHYPMVRHWNGKLIVNPGSVGQPRDHAGGACYAVLDTSRKEVSLCRVSYDFSSLIEDSRAHDPSLPYLCEVLAR